MKRLNSIGVVNVWLIGFIVVTLLLFGIGGFAVWAYSGRQDYKENVDQKISVAVAESNEALDAKKEADFREREKEPFRSYDGPAAYGSLTIKYPKTWSVYVDEAGNGGVPLDGYMHPKYVPGIKSGNNVAVRFSVMERDYDSQVKQFDNAVKKGTVKAKAYSSLSDPKNVGIRFDGEIAEKKQGAVILLPLRDKTIKVWTEASQYVPDFNKIILPNFRYIP